MAEVVAKTENEDRIDPSILDAVPVSVEAYLGFASISVGELSRLRPGDVFALDQALGDPVELRLNGAAVAYGELVTKGDNFAVRITAIARP